MKPAILYYSAAVPHPEIPKAFWARFSLVGAVPEWVTGFDGSRRVFGSKEEAELAGYRAMMMRMNKSRVQQTAVVRAVTPQPESRSRTARESEVARVFSRFKKPGTTGH